MLEFEEGLERTEQPTERRRQEARDQGQFAFSHELANALVLLAGACAIWWGGVALVHGLRGDLLERLNVLPVEMNTVEAGQMLNTLFARGLELTGAVMAGLLVVGLAANIAQAGFRISPEALGPKWEKLNPVTGWQKILSLQGAARGIWSVAKVLVVACVVWSQLQGREGQIAALADGSLSHSVTTAWDLAKRLLMAVAASLVTIGAGDYAVQWWRNEKALMMTKQSLKDEQKEEEGDPKLRGQRRQRAREIVQQRKMMTELPKATLVITNPTHLAIALRYERGVNSAPIVIAKGRDAFALQMQTKARRHGIPVIEKKPLARALYKSVKVGEEIPQALYLAVSEVLAYVFRLRAGA